MFGFTQKNVSEFFQTNSTIYAEVWFGLAWVTLSRLFDARLHGAKFDFTLILNVVFFCEFTDLKSNCDPLPVNDPVEDD